MEDGASWWWVGVPARPTVAAAVAGRLEARQRLVGQRGEVFAGAVGDRVPGSCPSLPCAAGGAEDHRCPAATPGSLETDRDRRGPGQQHRADPPRALERCGGDGLERLLLVAIGTSGEHVSVALPHVPIVPFGAARGGCFYTDGWTGPTGRASTPLGCKSRPWDLTRLRSVAPWGARRCLSGVSRGRSPLRRRSSRSPSRPARAAQHDRNRWPPPRRRRTPSAVRRPPRH